MTERRLQLVRYEPININFYYFSGWRMRIECAEAQGDDLDKYIFIWKLGEANPYTGNRLDIFQTVCGPADIADIPIGEPDPNMMWPFYRLDYLEHDFRAIAHVDEFWRLIKQEARVLTEALTKFSNLSETERLWIPSPPDTGDSVSDSESL